MERIMNRRGYPAFAGTGWKTRKQSGLSPIWGLIALALALAGCGGGSTGNVAPPVKTSSIIVEVHNSEGKALAGFEVFTSPATRTAVTDSTGRATFSELTEGGYGVTVQKAGYISFSQVYTAAAGFPVVVAVTYFPRVSLVIRDEKGRPASGAVLSSTPPLPEKVLDLEGKTEFANLPSHSYTFLLKRGNYPDTYIRNVTLKANLELAVESSAPQVTILSPATNAKIASTRNLRFSGAGSDIEDGELPDSSLVWSSNQSGELGRGRELVVEMLPAGDHTITLAGIDSDGKRSETSVNISIFDYYLDTYFPLPIGETWNYRVQVPEFYVTDSLGQSEFWSIKQLSVTMNKGPVRTITMVYDVARGETVYRCVYTLADNLQIEDSSVYITSTQEEYTESVSSVPSLKMYFTTSYIPRYLLFKNFTDLTAMKTWAMKSDITIRWNYTYYGEPSSSFTEWRSITASFSLGEEQSIETDAGTFPARELTVKESGFTRKWMLAKGLGIIRIEDESYDPVMTAVLHDSSVLQYTRKTSGPATNSAPPPRYDLRIDRHNPRDIQALCRMLSGMCPR